MFFGDAVVKWMLALGHLHKKFPLRVRRHLAENELPPPLTGHSSEMNGIKDKCHLKCFVFKLVQYVFFSYKEFSCILL